MSPSAEILDVAALKSAIAEGWRPKYVLFWGHTSKGSQVGKHVLSQWWPARFELDGQSYCSAEQYMMAEKATLFGDRQARDRILATEDPGKAKALGRSVEHFDEAVWEQSRFEITVRGNLAKFGQNGELRRYLVETGDKVLVEASPVDRIWGIGLAASDPRCERPDEWLGLNLLGFALMRARAVLKSV